MAVTVVSVQPKSTTTTSTKIVASVPHNLNDDDKTKFAGVISSSSASSTSSETSDDSSLMDDSSVSLPSSSSSTESETTDDIVNNERSVISKYYNDSSKQTSQRLRQRSTTIWDNPLFQTIISLLVWGGIIIVPLVLSSPYSPISYRDVFPKEWYENDPTAPYAKTLGIVLSMFAIVVGQTLMLIFFLLYRFCANPIPVQTKGATEYPFWQGVYEHLAQPKPLLVLGTFLLTTWYCRILPDSYYNFHGTIQWQYIIPCLCIQDFVQYTMHRVVHSVSGSLYQFSHKRHHKFINPIIFDTFKGTIPDTILTVLLPITCTTQLMRNCNIWTFMTFGCLDFNWGTVIHSEYILPWDNFFTIIKFGTAADHHVHHLYFNYNYGHLFMYWDIVFGTYRAPKSFGARIFNVKGAQLYDYDRQQKVNSHRRNKKQN